MTEPLPTYSITADGNYVEIVASPITDPTLRALIEMLRRQSIEYVRFCDRMLGRPQTIPERIR